MRSRCLAGGTPWGQAKPPGRLASPDARRGPYDVAIDQQLAGKPRPHPAQHGADAGDQLARAERLGHIIVGAGLEAADAVALSPRAVSMMIGTWRLALAAQPAADLDPADRPRSSSRAG